MSARLPAWCWPAFFLGMIGLYWFAVRGASLWAFSYRNLLAESGVCLIVGWMLPRFHHATNRPMVTLSHWIAKHSYGIYLTHMSIMWVALVRMERAPILFQWLTLVLLAVTIPVVSYRLIESPMIDLGRKLAHAAGRRLDDSHQARAITAAG